MQPRFQCPQTILNCAPFHKIIFNPTQLDLMFLAVTWQLYRFTCHSLTHSLTPSLLKNTTKEHSERLVTLETCYQSDEETWPDKQKDNDKDKYKDNDNDNENDIWRTPSKSDPRDFWHLRHLIRVMRRHDLTKKIQWQRQIERQRQWQRQIHLESTFKERS